MSEYPKVIDIGGDMWSGSTLPATHQVVPLADVEVRKHGRDGLDYRVEFKDGGPGGGIYSDEATAEGAERNALAWLAIARHLREHPPVDEEQVKALRGVMIEESGYLISQSKAESLYRRGVRVVDE